MVVQTVRRVSPSQLRNIRQGVVRNRDEPPDPIARQPSTLTVLTIGTHEVDVDGYVYRVPAVREGRTVVLKTIYPSRQATKRHRQGDAP